MWRNPLHLFIYLREEARHRLRLHRRVVTLSRADTEAIVAAYPSTRGRVVELANAVDVPRFATAAARRGEVREAMGVREDDIVLLFVGHEFDRKGLPYIIRALGHLDEHHRLWVVGGDDSMISHARGDAARAGVKERTTFFGTQRDRVEDFLAGADVFVLASSYEVTPLVLLEAMAAGVVPVSTPVGAAPDIIQHGVNGFLVERDESSIAAGIEAATQNRQRLGELSKLAAESAEPFDWPAVVSGYLDLITSVHAEKSRR
jgi:UDP-glucose:(heptosyl)LPS alpha-1,3-glucosyltransferase